MLHETLIRAFERQAAWCRGPSPFTARLLTRTQHWLQQSPEAAAVLAAVDADPAAAAVSLRWAGALHHLALRGLGPWAALWPPRRDTADLGDAEFDAAIAAAWQQQRDAIVAALAHPPQTNEVQRSAALLPGLLHVAAATGLPLALLEIGASAGLNLWCERHRHDHGTWAWGDAAAALVLRSEWRGPPPAHAAAALKVVERTGCDAQPIDLAQPGEALRLTSFVWPDQADRLARLRTAQSLAAGWARAESVTVERRGAAAFVAEQLQRRRPGRTTVLMHSIVWQYLGAAEQQAIASQLQTAGAAATTAAPLAWLRMEPPRPDAAVELRCTLWPGGEDHRLAMVHPHGSWIEWLP